MHVCLESFLLQDLINWYVVKQQFQLPVIPADMTPRKERVEGEETLQWGKWLV